MDIRPNHVARVLAVLCALPVFWIFVIQGVETTTEYDLATGDTSTSSNLGSQLAKAAIFLVLAGVFALPERYLSANNTQWPPAIQQMLASANLAAAQPPAAPPPRGSAPPPGAGPQVPPRHNYQRPNYPPPPNYPTS